MFYLTPLVGSWSNLAALLGNRDPLVKVSTGDGFIVLFLEEDGRGGDPVSVCGLDHRSLLRPVTC